MAELNSGFVEILCAAKEESYQSPKKRMKRKRKEEKMVVLEANVKRRELEMKRHYQPNI